MLMIFLDSSPAYYIFHRNQKVTGALPKMAISCTTPTDILTYCTFWIVTSCNIHKSKSYKYE